MENLNNHFEKVKESIKLLSLSYDEQVNYFPKFVDIPCEILNTFDSAFLLLPNIIENGIISNKSIAMILRLNNFINITLSNTLFKDLSEEQFKSSEEWNKIRILAKETFNLLA